MFGFFKPRPPLSTAQRVDIELLMRRSVEQIGSRHVRQIEVVTQLDQLNLDRSSHEALLESAAREVHRRMPTVTQPCNAEIAKAEQFAYPSLYRPATESAPARICVSTDTLDDPLRTVIEYAYQWAAHFWHTRPAGNQLDTNPRTTNLMPVCSGLGVLASDACFYDQQWSQAGWTGWTMSRSGYYNAAEIGYALALLARLLGERAPAWKQTLRLDSRETLDRAAKYFDHHQNNGGALLFEAESIPSSSGDMRQLANWLGGDDTTFAMASALALVQRDDVSALAIEAAIDATHRSDPDLVPIATRVLGRARHAPEVAEKRVGQLIRSARPEVCFAAIKSAAELGISLVPYTAVLNKLIESYPEDSIDLIELIGGQGRNMEGMAAKLCQSHLARSIRQKDDEMADALLKCLSRIVGDPRQTIEATIKSPQIREQALERYSARENRTPSI